jgi:hypothetical protein
MLYHTKYVDWTLLIHVMLEARQIWVAFNNGTLKRRIDHTTMEFLLWSIPPEMLHRMLNGSSREIKLYM